MLKTCSKCNLELDISEFNKSKTSSDGFSCWCRPCNKNYKILWKAKNLNNIAEYNKKYKAENKELIAQRKKEWYASHVVEASEYNKKHRKMNFVRKVIVKLDDETRRIRRIELKKKWHKDNKDRCCAYKQKRKSLKRKLPHTLTNSQWINIKNHFNNKCCYCDKESNLEQEHFVALSNGGGYTINNIVPSCKSCNNNKATKSFFEWYPTYKHYSKKREKKILKHLNYSNENQQLTLEL